MNSMENVDIDVGCKGLSTHHCTLYSPFLSCLTALFFINPLVFFCFVRQTNVYLSAQKKKMRPFEGFNRKAIVCIPTQEDLKKRTEDRKKEGIELPENAVSDMKSMLMIMFILFPVFYSVDDPLDGMPIPHSLFLEGRGGGKVPSHPHLFPCQGQDSDPERQFSHLVTISSSIMITIQNASGTS